MSSVRSIAGSRRAVAERRAEVRHDVHRVGRRAAVAERQQPPAGAKRARSAAAAAASASRAVAQRLLAQRGRLVRLRQHGRAHVGDDRLEVVLLLGEERVEERATRRCRGPARRGGPRAGRGARRTRARAPTARGRAVSASSWRTKRVARRLELDRPGSRARRARRRAPRRSRGSPASNAITHVVRLGDERDLLRQRPALGGQRERGQRPLADDHRVDELDRDVARVRARRAASGRARAAGRRARSAPPARWQSRAIRSASAPKQRSPAATRSRASSSSEREP